MKIGLIDVDGHASKKKWGATIYPNLALCKIPSYHTDVAEGYGGLVQQANVFRFLRFQGLPAKEGIQV